MKYWKQEEILKYAWTGESRSTERYVVQERGLDGPETAINESYLD
jgi:hypothetical protein